MEKDSSIYKLKFSWDFGVRRKDLKGEEAPSVYSWEPPPASTITFSWSAQDGLQGSLGAVDLSDAKLSLSKSVGYHCGCEVLSSATPSEGKLFETRWWRSGVRGNGSLQHEAAARQPLATFLPMEAETVWLPQISHICVTQLNNQVAYSCWRGEDSNGNGTEGLLIWEVGGFPSGDTVDWCSLFTWTLTALLLIFCTQSEVQTG